MLSHESTPRPQQVWLRSIRLVPREAVQAAEAADKAAGLETGVVLGRAYRAVDAHDCGLSHAAMQRHGTGSCAASVQEIAVALANRRPVGGLRLRPDVSAGVRHIGLARLRFLALVIVVQLKAGFADDPDAGLAVGPV